jgi:potassium/hydrogen antiporter
VTHDALLVLVAGALLGAGVVASLVAARLRLPALVLFLGVGMAIGTDGLGWIDFDDYSLARLIGSVALVLILFEGGLASGFGEIRPVLRPAIALATLGTFLTALIAGATAHALLDFSFKESLLLGAVLSGTDGAAVFALLRGARLPRRIASMLEGEAGLNDPIAVLLVLAMIKLITTPTYGAGDVLVFFVQELALGVVGGLVVGVIGALAV